MVFSESKIGPPSPLIKQIYGSASEVHLTDRIISRKRIILYKSFVANLLDCDFWTTLMLHTCDMECFISTRFLVIAMHKCDNISA